jgi:hypothetical protein
MKYKVINKDNQVVEAATKREAFEIFKKEYEDINLLLFDVKPVVQISKQKTEHLKKKKELEETVSNI